MVAVGSKQDAGRRPPIFDSVSSSPPNDAQSTGAFPGAGTFYCLDCGSQLSTRQTESLPRCPECGGSRFRRDSIFAARQEHRDTATGTSELTLPHPPSTPDWLGEAREALNRPGRFLALREENGTIRTFKVDRGWTRIGRSPNADLRLDHPSVSRRHALIVSEPGRPLRVLDDRSLNGIFLNGEPIEWATLKDGDEIVLGRYHVYALER